MPPNILVVDDHESMRRRIRSLLGSAGIGICAEAATSPTSPYQSSSCTRTNCHMVCCHPALKILFP
jgi:CheY-like chemotaxis protein